MNSNLGSGNFAEDEWAWSGYQSNTQIQTDETVLAEYIRPNEYPRNSNSPSGTLQIRVFSSLTVSFGLPMISRSRCSATAASPIDGRSGVVYIFVAGEPSEHLLARQADE